LAIQEKKMAVLEDTNWHMTLPDCSWEEVVVPETRITVKEVAAETVVVSFMLHVTGLFLDLGLLNPMVLQVRILTLTINLLRLQQRLKEETVLAVEVLEG
jgi:hypothetical protein